MHFLDGPSRFCHPQHLLHPATLTASNHDTAQNRDPGWVMDARESPDSTHKDEPITAEEMEKMIDQWAASCAKQLADNIGKQGRQISIRKRC